MVTQPTDIAIVLSGGPTNTDPNKSLGGQSSATPVVSGNLNNLFDDVTADEGEAGSEEYRCIYIYNDGDTAIYNCRVWIASETESGATAEIGVLALSEVQRIRLVGEQTSGTFSVMYEGATAVVTYNTDSEVLATNLQNSLNNLRHPTTNAPLLRQVIVRPQQVSGTTLLLDVDFSGGLGGNGQDDFRNHDLLTISDNSLDPAPEITVSVLQEGSPINSIAEVVDLETQPPQNVGFYKPTSVSPINIPKLLPEEGFSVWVKRITPSAVTPTEADGLTIRFRTNSLDPLG